MKKTSSLKLGSEFLFVSLLVVTKTLNLSSCKLESIFIQSGEKTIEKKKEEKWRSEWIEWVCCCCCCCCQLFFSDGLTIIIMIIIIVLDDACMCDKGAC